MKAQRLRVTFARGDAMKYVTHLDMMRFWERALRRAAVPVAYSEGFSPHAQIAIAAPLAVGMTSDAELMDVFLAELMPPRAFIEALSPQLPQGVTVLSAEEAGLTLPALQADVRFAEYDVDIEDAAAVDVTAAAAAVERFLAAETIPWEHQRENETRAYDIRVQVQELSVVPSGGCAVRVHMRLKNDNTGSGRPEQVVAALGLPAPSRIHRTKLVLQKHEGAREAWRRAGQFEV